MKKASLVAIFVGLLSVSLTVNARAGMIVNANLPTNVELLDSELLGLNNDNTSASLPDLINDSNIDFNFFFLVKDFPTTDPIDFSLDVINTGGTTEYFIVEALVNNSNRNWSEYHLELGVGSGDSFTSLSSLGAEGSGLDFDTPDQDPTPESFTTDGVNITPIYASVQHEEDAIKYFDGVITPFDDGGDGFDFTDPAFVAFSIDVPDTTVGESYSFTLRQYPSPPVVPEPATMSLLAGGLLGAGVLRRKRS